MCVCACSLCVVGLWVCVCCIYVWGRHWCLLMPWRYVYAVCSVGCVMCSLIQDLSSWTNVTWLSSPAASQRRLVKLVIDAPSTREDISFLLPSFLFPAGELVSMEKIGLWDQGREMKGKQKGRTEGNIRAKSCLLADG